MENNPYQTPKSDLDRSDIPARFFQGLISARQLKVVAWIIFSDIAISLILDVLYYTDIRYQITLLDYGYQFLTVLSCCFWLYIYSFLIRYFKLRYDKSLRVMFYLYMLFAVVFTVSVLIGDRIEDPDTWNQYLNAYDAMTLAYIAVSALFVRLLIRIEHIHKQLKLFAWLSLASACVLYIALLYPLSAAIEYASSFFLARVMLLSAKELLSRKN